MLLLFSYILLIPVTVLFHELGHALAALLVIKQRVLVFVGSYGNTENGFHFSIGLITFYFTSNPFLWWRGLCKQTSLRASVTQRIIFTAGGPFASLLLAVAASCLAIIYFGDGGTGFFFSQAATITVIYFFSNVFPSNKKYKLHNGTAFENDGRQIMSLLKQRKFPISYIHALAFYQEQKFDEASALLEHIVIEKKYGVEFCRNTLSIHLAAGEYEKALLAHTFLKENFILNSNDYSNVGLIKGRMGLQQEALAAMEESLNLNPQNFYPLHNKGFFLTEWGKYEAAIPYLDKAISINPNSGMTYSFRARARLKTGDIENGLADIRRSLEINPNNADTYKILGIYYLETGNKKEALSNLIKAKQLDKNSDDIDGLISTASKLTTN